MVSIVYQPWRLEISRVEPRPRPITSNTVANNAIARLQNFWIILERIYKYFAMNWENTGWAPLRLGAGLRKVCVKSFHLERYFPKPRNLIWQMKYIRTCLVKYGLCQPFWKSCVINVASAATASNKPRVKISWKSFGWTIKSFQTLEPSN